MIKATIITIGDEILIGQIVDTNSVSIAKQLNAAGITVAERLSVGDDAARIEESLRHALAQSQVVILTGGLGPTKDDITKFTLARIFSARMVEDKAVAEHVRTMLARRGIEFNELNRSQALVPDTCTVLPNRHGTAPGMWFETAEGGVVVSLPGVPFEMEHLMQDEVMPRLKHHFSLHANIHRTMITAGLAESMLAARIADMARAMLSYELSPHLDIALADHISFAIKRSKEGIYLQMPFTYDIQQSYPVEYKIAEYAVRLVKSDLGVFLPSTEASGIAMSIVNSAVAPSGQASAEQARRQEDMLERVTGIVEAEMDVHVDREGFGFSRFATHVQYLMRRVLDGDAIASENSSIYVQLALDNPEVSACVDVIASMIEEEYETVLTEEEKLYLILHVNRICARSDG